MTDGRAGGSRVRTVFLGSGEFGRPSLRVLAEHPAIELVGVVTAAPKPSGRQQRITATPIGDAARELGVTTILTPERLRSPAAIAAVLDLRPDLAVLADYGQIVPADLLGFRHRALNLHPSLLPRHRGATPIPSAILAGDAETGVSLMQMDEGLDTGPIVAQRRIALDGSELTPTLETRLAGLAADVLAASLGPWIAGTIDPKPQADGMNLTRPLRREDGRLDPRRSATELERQVRAYQPWPGSFVDSVVGRLTVWSAFPDLGEGPTPGTFDAGGLGVGDGQRLRLIEVQPAAGKRMPWDAFMRGRPAIVGSAVVPGP